MAIYLQEIIRIDGGGKEAYLESVRTGFAPYAARSRGMRLVWLGSTIGSTATWPETIAVWELRDWRHYAEACSRMYTESSDDLELVSWWRGAAKLFRRSRSQTLVGASFCPTLDQLLERGVSGTAFAFSTYRIRPGRGPAFFTALERRARLEEERGRRLVGAYEVAFTNDRGYAIWAYPTLADLAGFERSRRSDSCGSERAGLFGDVIDGWSEHWGYAAPGTPLSPVERGARIW